MIVDWEANRPLTLIVGIQAVIRDNRFKAVFLFITLLFISVSCDEEDKSISKNRKIDLDTVGYKLGPKTEAFFDSVERRFQRAPTDYPMELGTRVKCDLNHDGKCDTLDLNLFKAAFGSCLGDSIYNPLADADGDGCVTITDHKYLFSPIKIEMLGGEE